MSDISVIWDSANSRGDWSFEPLTVAGQVINVSAPSTFGIGDGVSTLFQLSATQGRINGIISAQLYRNDWQGNQLLYATPRTNLIKYSQDLTNAVWTKTNATVTAGGGGTAPDGVTTAGKLVESATNTSHVARQNYNFVAGQQYTITLIARAQERFCGTILAFADASHIATLQFNLSTGVVSNGSTSMPIVGSSITSLGGGWYAISMTITAAGTITAGYFDLRLSNVWPVPSGTGATYLGDGTSGMNIFCWQVEAGSTPTGYIPTNTAPVTVTDYTLSPTGSATLSVPPTTDAALAWTGAYVSDTVSGGDLATGLDLETAVLVSLFTDRMANRDDPIPDGSGDPRGWWGDIGEDKPIGSRLWLLDRSKQTQEVLNNARDYIFEALQWLVDDGVVASIDVQTQWVRDTFLGAQVTLYQPTGPNVSMTYAWAWNQLS